MANPIKITSIFFAIFLMLNGCGWQSPSYNPTIANNPPSISKPVVNLNTQNNSALANNAPSGSRQHIIQQNESYYTIANLYKVNLRDLIIVNNLRPPYIPYVGERLIIPSQSLYKVSSGDTLYGISRRFGLDLSELVRLNQLQPPYLLKVGDQLRLPGKVAINNAKPELAQPEPIQTEEIKSEEIQPIELASPSPIPESSQTSETVNLTENVNSEIRASNENNRNNSAQYQLRISASGKPIPPMSPNQAPLSPIAKNINPPSLAKGGFIWPVRGRVIAKYGVLDRGLNNDGINIAAPKGASVRAAQNGVVAYRGSELKGFGQLILIRHADGYVTAYAHNEEILVNIGQTVTRGETIAKVGSSGNVDTPQLHFQIRKGQKKLNPQQYLKG